MIGRDGIAQGLTAYMRINFRGADAFVSQHFLYGPQVGAILDQFGGKAVTQ